MTGQFKWKEKVQQELRLFLQKKKNLACTFSFFFLHRVRAHGAARLFVPQAERHIYPFCPIRQFAHSTESREVLSQLKIKTDRRTFITEWVMFPCKRDRFSFLSRPWWKKKKIGQKMTIWSPCGTPFYVYKLTLWGGDRVFKEMLVLTYYMTDWINK